MTVRYLPGLAKQVLNERGEVERTLAPTDRLMVSKEDRARLVLSAPERVEVVRRIFSLYLRDGIGFKAIAHYLITTACHRQAGAPLPGR